MATLDLLDDSLDAASHRTTPKTSAVRRHFAQYARQDEMSDELELGWDCGICLDTAEDPCVTRCGHLYCHAHLNHWLTAHPSCPVCKSPCTPARDVVPIFSRGRTSPTSSPPPSPDHQSGSPTPTVPWQLPAPSPDANTPPHTATLPHTAPPHPLLASHVLAHYLALALRMLGLAILLAVLLR